MKLDKEEQLIIEELEKNNIELRDTESNYFVERASLLV